MINLNTCRVILFGVNHTVYSITETKNNIDSYEYYYTIRYVLQVFVQTGLQVICLCQALAGAEVDKV